jgi:hypothetical protein
MKPGDLGIILGMTQAMSMEPPQRRVRTRDKPRGLTGKQWSSRKSNQKMSKISKKQNRRK